MSATDQPSEDELRAAYEAEIKKIRIEQILLEQVVSIINLGMRRTGLAPGTEDERDIGQVRVAIEAVRALLPLIEQSAPPQAAQIRDALSQLQLAFVQLGGAGAAEGAAGAAPGTGSTPGPGASTPGSGASTPGPGASTPEPPPPAEDPSRPADPRRPAPPAADEPTPGEGGPAQRSGRLWVPGQ